MFCLCECNMFHKTLRCTTYESDTSVLTAQLFLLTNSASAETANCNVHAPLKQYSTLLWNYHVLSHCKSGIDHIWQMAVWHSMWFSSFEKFTFLRLHFDFLHDTLFCLQLYNNYFNHGLTTILVFEKTCIGKRISFISNVILKVVAVMLFIKTWFVLNF
jgi:hypothetical protein